MLYRQTPNLPSSTTTNREPLTSLGNIIFRRQNCQGQPYHNPNRPKKWITNPIWHLNGRQTKNNQLVKQLDPLPRRSIGANKSKPEENQVETLPGQEVPKLTLNRQEPHG